MRQLQTTKVVRCDAVRHPYPRPVAGGLERRRLGAHRRDGGAWIAPAIERTRKKQSVHRGPSGGAFHCQSAVMYCRRLQGRADHLETHDGIRHDPARDSRVFRDVLAYVWRLRRGRAGGRLPPNWGSVSSAWRSRSALTVLTMAYAVGHISGGHFNPAVTLGLWSAGRCATRHVLPYIVAQVVGAIVGAAVLYVIASGKGRVDAERICLERLRRN